MCSYIVDIYVSVCIYIQTCSQSTWKSPGRVIYVCGMATSVETCLMGSHFVWGHCLNNIYPVGGLEHVFPFMWNNNPN